MRGGYYEKYLPLFCLLYGTAIFARQSIAKILINGVMREL
jgi:hypothetical protein